MKRTILFILICVFSVFSNCDNEPTEPTNNIPIIVSITASPLSLSVDETTSLSCAATDADGDILTYNWSADGGTFSNGISGSSANWKAPNEAGIFVIKVIVSDGKSTAQQEINITVTEANGILEGIVYRINTSTTVSGVLVEAGGQSATSNGDGTYRIENIPIGEASVKATMAGYLIYEQDATITADQTTEHNVYMEENDDPCSGTSTVTHANKTYNTVQIGPQCWLKENLNIGIMIERNSTTDIQTDNRTIEKFCFDNDEKNCDTYGGLYQWGETMQYITTEGSQGLCPTGWHVPTKSDFETLINTVGGSGNALKALGQGTGTDASGFSALLAGHRDHNDGLSHAQGDDTIFWGSTEEGSEGISIDLYKNSNAIFSSTYHKEHGFSIRCVKD